MFIQSEFERIHKDFINAQKERSNKLKKIWVILLLCTLVLIGIFLVIFPDQFKYAEVAWILPTYGGLLLLTTLIGFIVSVNYLSEKPFFDVLYRDIYQKINLQEGTFFEYESYDSDGKEINKKGGLFTGYAQVKTRRHIKGSTAEGFKFDILDCTMTTSNGKNQQTHFDGIYFVLHKQTNSVFQVRTNGSPKLKGTKFDKQLNYTNIKVYKEQDKETTNYDHSLVEFVTRLSNQEQIKKIYLSTVDGEIHLAIKYKKHPARKHKTLTIETLDKTLEYFLSEYRLLNDLSNVGGY